MMSWLRNSIINATGCKRRHAQKPRLKPQITLLETAHWCKWVWKVGSSSTVVWCRLHLMLVALLVATHFATQFCHKKWSWEFRWNFVKIAIAKSCCNLIPTKFPRSFFAQKYAKVVWQNVLPQAVLPAYKMQTTSHNSLKIYSLFTRQSHQCAVLSYVICLDVWRMVLCQWQTF